MVLGVPILKHFRVVAFHDLCLLQAIRGELSQFVDEMVIPESMIKYVAISKKKKWDT